ncbi:hypothetical protein HPB51_023792 [Rhipicephalus microplus]|uniref:Uncharacterized protein n=1 Tax=Rhipicephalus microplus TaxID=6941 RepID=A0A9J6DD23_RHIMP|nr:hypothetical protein HPB51_023792 [Rhipicephalus microplus]
MEPEPEVISGAGADSRNDLQVAFLPLMTADRQLLPLHFLTQGEDDEGAVPISPENEHWRRCGHGNVTSRQGRSFSTAACLFFLRQPRIVLESSTHA